MAALKARGRASHKRGFSMSKLCQKVCLCREGKEKFSRGAVPSYEREIEQQRGEGK